MSAAFCRNSGDWVHEVFVHALGARSGNPRAVMEVSMDMNPFCTAGVQKNIGGQAVRAFDRVHVIAHVNDALNAFLEALNGVFPAVKRKARGFRSTENLIAMLYFTAAKLRISDTHLE